jgi:nucleotide-binding universal stress UspA family protein
MSQCPIEVRQVGTVRIEWILCPVDFSEFSTRAYEYALSLARHYRAKLFLQHVVQPLTSAYPYYAFPDSWNELYWNLDANASAELRKLVQAHDRNGIQPECVVQRGLPPESILAFAKEHAVNLIVTGTHGRRGLDHLTLGSVTERVLRKASCMVLAVREPSHDFVNVEWRDPVHLRRILLCTDFSECSYRAADYALSLALEYQAELTMLRVLEKVGSTEFVREGTEIALHEIEKSIPADARSRCTIESIVRIGKPYEEIVKFAQEAYTDLVVMGVRGRNALDLALFGSTVHRVIQVGSCPVLAVH